MADSTFLTILAAVVALALIVFVLSSARRIRPYEQGVVTVFGAYRGLLHPGLNFVPFMASVHRVDLRSQVAVVRPQEIRTANGGTSTLGLTVTYRVVDAPRAYFQVQDYRGAVLARAESALRATVAEAASTTTATERAWVLDSIRARIAESTDPWGLRLESLELN